MAVLLIGMKAFLIAVGLVATVVTRSANATPEPRQTTTGVPEKWCAPVTLVLDPSLDDLGPGGAGAVQVALATWAESIARLPKITFVMGTERGAAAFDGKSVVLAAPITTPGQENDLALTTTYAATDSGNILEADIVFNTNYTFAVMPTVPSSCAQMFDIGAVATHEAGHFFGLGEDYDDLAATMYVTTNACDSHKRALTADDTTALTSLYAPPTELIAHCDAAPTAKTKPTAVLAIVALGLALVTARRRARGPRVVAPELPRATSFGRAPRR